MNKVDGSWPEGARPENKRAHNSHEHKARLGQSMGRSLPACERRHPVAHRGTTGRWHSQPILIGVRGGLQWWHEVADAAIRAVWNRSVGISSWL